MAPFRYKPLETAQYIRIIELFPGQSKSKIECNLHHIDLSSKIPAYIALSYVWGSPDDRKKISLNGSDFEVTTNLHAALENLRDTSPKRLKLRLWIDAISINQADLEERSTQVRRMKVIYESADQIAAWLGPEADNSNLAMTKIETLSEFYARFKEKDSQSDDMAGRHGIGGKLDLTDPALMGKEYDPEPWVALAKLFARPWWRRAWILQESTTFVETILTCGGISVRREMVKNAFRVIASVSEYPECASLPLIPIEAAGGLLTFTEWRNTIGMGGRRMHMLSIMETFRSLEATDPRDKVYAPLNLATDISPGDLVIDYKAPVHEVYTDLATHCIFKDGFDLDVLGHCFGELRDLTIPSWVPDWRVEPFGSPFHKRIVSDNREATSNAYHASGTSISPQHYFPNGKPGLVVNRGRVLVVKAIFVDTIGDMTDHSAWKLDDARAWAPANGPTHPYPLTDETLGEAYLRTIVADMKESKPSAITRGHAMMWESFSTEHYDPLLNPEKRRVESPLSVAVLGRRFAVSKAGLVALVPEHAMIGDVLSVLLGGQVFYLLRPWEGEKEGHFQLIGECYVHGLMDGKVMEYVREGSAEVQNIGIW